jgi:hypothetical protein
MNQLFIIDKENLYRLSIRISHTFVRGIFKRKNEGIFKRKDERIFKRKNDSVNK